VLVALRHHAATGSHARRRIAAEAIESRCGFGHDAGAPPRDRLPFRRLKEALWPATALAYGNTGVLEREDGGRGLMNVRAQHRKRRETIVIDAFLVCSQSARGRRRPSEQESYAAEGGDRRFSPACVYWRFMQVAIGQRCAFRSSRRESLLC